MQAPRHSWIWISLLAFALPFSCNRSSGGGGGGQPAGNPGNGNGGGGNNNVVVERVDTSANFVPLTDPDDQQAMAQDLLNTLVSANCWDSSFLTDPTFFGSVGSVQQWTFSGDSQLAQYRFVGFETHVGAIVLLAAGSFHGFPTVIVSTWTGDIEAIVLVSSTRFVHAILHIDGVTPIWTEYGPTGGPCL
jgi:hypothetical protein